MMIQFTPKKFIDAIELNGYKITNLVKVGVDRSYFVPRYKKGSRKIKDLGDYKKKLNLTTIQKIADILVEYGYFDDKTQIIYCFRTDDFEALIPKELL